MIAPISSSTEKIVSFGENIHRTKLPYSDTIRVCDELFNTLSGDKFEKIQTIAQTLGISPQTVSKYLSYKLVPDEVQDMVNEKKLSASLAYRITSAFWPNTEKIVKIADYMTKMTKSEWERALDIGIKNPKSTVDDIIEEAKKPKITYEIRIILDAETHKLLNGIAKERNLEPATLVMNLINDFLESELND